MDQATGRLLVQSARRLGRWRGRGDNDRVGAAGAATAPSGFVHTESAVTDPSRLSPMGGLAPEPAVPPDWETMRADALAFIRTAFGHSKIEAEKYLLDYLCASPPAAWRSKRRFSVRGLRDGEERAVGGRLYRFDAARRQLIEVGREALLSPPSPRVEKRTPLQPFLEDIEAAIQNWFWKIIRDGFGRAEGNSAFYAGPVFQSFPSVKFKTKTGVELEAHNAVGVLADEWWIEIHLSAIRFRAAPLIEAVRSDGGQVAAGLSA